MRFYTKQHPFSCGIELPARPMYGCILRQDGERVRHRNMPAGPDPFLQAIAPSREDLVVCVAWIFPWSWLAALGGREGIALVRGHALYRQALHGGKATNDKIDAPNMALLLRGGMVPQAYGSPAALRATRDLLRRRRQLVRKRAALLPHVQQTNRPYTLPEMGQTIAYTANRDGVAERFPEPAVPKRIEVALALIGQDDALLRALAWAIVTTATHHEAHTLSVLQTVPGLGKRLSLGLLEAIHARGRCPRVQACVSSCRVVTCAKASAGKR